MELTRKVVETVLYEGRSYMSKSGRKRWSRHEIWDDDLPGFGLRITSTNRKSFIVAYRAGGRKRTKTLGTADKLQLDEARRLAVEFLEASDETPSSKASRQPEIEGVETVAQLADAYLENHLKSSTPSWFNEQRLIRTHIKPALGRSRIAEVTQTDLTSLSARVARRFPADARRLRPLLTGMFEWAQERGLWSKSARRAAPGAARPATPDTGPDAAAGAAADTEPSSEPRPEPPRSVEELTAALRDSEEERRELAARLEEVSSSGGEMLARINDQAAAHKELEATLAKSRRELDRARADAAALPDPDKTARQIHNLRQSVEQLMAKAEEAGRERDRTAARLAEAETRAAEQGRKVAALARARNKLEERLREEERKSAIRKVQSHGGEGRRPLVVGLAAGAIAGALLTLLLHWAFGGAQAPTPPARGESVASTGSGPAAPPDAQAAAGVAGGAAAAGGAEAGPQAGPPAAGGEPPAAAPAGGPDFTTAEAAVRSWAAAWSAQRVDDYLAAYSPSFTPASGQARGEWASQRRNRILRPPSIRVSLAALKVSETGPDRVRVTFEQSYETPTYADQVLKTLDLAWEQGGWKIVAELAD